MLAHMQVGPAMEMHNSMEHNNHHDHDIMKHHDTPDHHDGDKKIKKQRHNGDQPEPVHKHEKNISATETLHTACAARPAIYTPAPKA